MQEDMEDLFEKMKKELQTREDSATIYDKMK
jgi:hypothetical protein